MRRIIPTILAIGVIVCATAVFWKRQAVTTAALAAFRQQCAELRSQIETCDQTILDLRTSVARLQGAAVTGSPGRQVEKGHFSAGTEAEFARRLAELTIVQSNTLALVEKLTRHIPHLA
jgi:hypothetical protein